MFFRNPETKARIEAALEHYYAHSHYIPSPDVNPVSFKLFLDTNFF